jgi:hypothetical protein
MKAQYDQQFEKVFKKLEYLISPKAKELPSDLRKVMKVRVVNSREQGKFHSCCFWVVVLK